ncbi:glycosyltransferase family 2 protein [Tsuneonella sp. CC-YZS046]|uniref:glycosyltransferase n=1 Tax=Tsuneonella sp. CC-YZS046 TaxID=3042152 RepID=UPI002D7A364B|nr:glycosyltransferase family 2 protein [Tsuneonella sp. CC-YZS046]WRO66042.1 glycosyltransferase family 2 protein [Tsuneonella sp. CC-YZS046]
MLAAIPCFMPNLSKQTKDNTNRRIAASYVLPIAARSPQIRALSGYLRKLSRILDDVVVVDGSAPEVFDRHARAWGDYVRHIRPAIRTTNGKVAGVVTGVQAARHEAVVIADDDVRYRAAELRQMAGLLTGYEVVRPQNRFVPLPWHARWDTARSLLNRLTGGDWPGTLGVRKSALLKAGGYSGDALFENLEMVRTVKAAGGREALALDLIVDRRPPTAQHFLSQRTRQAYDEWARPGRLAAQLSLLPLSVWLTRRIGPFALVVIAALGITAAEAGRRKAGGQLAFPSSSALWAPAWLAERALTSWAALSTRLLFGGVKYRDKRLKRAATPMRELTRRVVG